MEATLFERGRLSGVQPSEFAAWVEPHLPAMSRYAARLVPAADRDDVVQEALVRAWRRHTTYDDRRGAPLPWLLAIVADRARRHRVRARPAASELVESPTHPVESHVDLERAVLQLSGRQRQAIDLHYFVGLDVASCAQVMGCAEGTVKATLHQARGRLRALLGDDFGGAS
jgi:RNA polymerase sigma factor (sigma-70 family)